MAFDREGTFNATPIAWGIRESKHSESVAVSIEWIPYEVLEEKIVDGEKIEEFVPYENDNGDTVQGDIWIVGKEGNIIRSNVEQTMKDTLGWSGNFEDLEEDGDFKPPKCQIDVEKDTYKGVKYKVNWVNPLGGGSRKLNKPGQGSTKGLADKFGDNIKRAMEGQDEVPF